LLTYVLPFSFWIGVHYSPTY